MNLLVAYGPIALLLLLAAIVGVLADRWTRLQGLRALNFEYEMLCLQMVGSTSFH